MKVIYVDDETALLNNFRMTVEGLSMVEELSLFRKGEEALKWAQEHPVDVAFLDIQMPVINGIELAKRLGVKSAQAVGGAVGHNPISIVVPCHRVLGADGSLTGYAGGVDKKARLLELERKHGK